MDAPKDASLYLARIQKQRDEVELLVANQHMQIAPLMENSRPALSSINAKNVRNRLVTSRFTVLRSAVRFLQ